MNLTSESPDRVLFLNGRQRRVLNVLLYASIPTDPKVGFTPLVRWLTQSYQASHADVLLNLVLDPAIDVYGFPNLKNAVFSAKGFDVAETDTVFLIWLKDEGLIGPARIAGDEPWPVAQQAVMIDGQPYGVPSWLRSDFLFSTGAGVQGVKTLADLQSYMAKPPPTRRALVGDLDGTWTIPAFTSRPMSRVTREHRHPTQHGRPSMPPSSPGWPSSVPSAHCRTRTLVSTALFITRRTVPSSRILWPNRQRMTRGFLRDRSSWRSTSRRRPRSSLCQCPGAIRLLRRNWSTPMPSLPATWPAAKTLVKRTPPVSRRL